MKSEHVRRPPRHVTPSWHAWNFATVFKNDTTDDTVLSVIAFESFLILGLIVSNEVRDDRALQMGEPTVVRDLRLQIFGWYARPESGLDDE